MSLLRLNVDVNPCMKAHVFMIQGDNNFLHQSHSLLHSLTRYI